MLPERLSRLVTGLVDGQLSVTEEKQARELLRRSGEARELFQQLKADAEQLAALPRLQLPAEFSEQVQASLPRRTIKVVERSQPSARRLSLRAAAIYAAAASLFLALGIAYVQRPGPSIEPAQANLTPDSGSPDAPGGKPAFVAEQLAPPRPEPAPSVLVSGSSGTGAPRAEVLVKTPRPESEVLGAPVPNTKPFRVYDPKAPLILTMREIDQPNGQGRLSEELAQAKAWRLDVNCQESEVATVRLKRSLQEQGIQLLVDPDASDRQRLRFAKTAYTILIENVTPAECLGILTGLRKVDRDEQARSRTGNQFVDMKLIRQSPEDGRRLEDLFGIKIGFREATKSVSPEVNSRDAAVMAAARAAAIWRGLNPEGQGTLRHAMLVADVVGRVRKPNNESQLFMNSRKSPNPDLLQLMLVLTPRKG